MAAASKLSTWNMASLGVMMASLGIGLLLMVGAMKKIADIPSDKVGGALVTLGVLIGGIIAVMVAFGKSVDAMQAINIKQAGVMLVKMAVAIGLLVVVIKLIATIKIGDLVKGLAVITYTMGLFAGLVAVSNIAGAHGLSAGKMLVKMAIAIGILALTIKLIATMSLGDIAKGMLVIAGCTGLFMAVIAVSWLAGANATKAGGMLWRMAFAMGVLALVIKLIAGIPFSDIVKGMATITGIEILFGMFIGMSNSIAAGAHRTGAMVLRMAFAIGVIAVVIKMISGIPNSDIIKGLATISAVMILFGAIIKVSQYAGKHSAAAGKMLLSMAGAIAVLVIAITLLSFLTPQEVAIGTAAISALMGCFALILSCMKKIRVDAKMLTALGIIIGAIGLMALAVGLLAQLPKEDLTAAGATLASVMGAFALVLGAASLLKPGKGVIKSILSLTALLIPLGLLAVGLAKMPNISEKKDSIIALVGVMSAMTLLMIPLAIIGQFTGLNSLAGIAGLTALAGSLYLFGLAIKDVPDVSGKRATLEALATVMTAMTLLLIPLSIIGLLGLGALAGVVALTSLAGTLLVFGAFISLIPDLGGKIGTIDILTKLMYSMTSLLVPLSLIGFLAISAILGVVALTSLVLPLWAFANTIAGLPDITGASATIDILTVFMQKMAGILVQISPMALLSSIAVIALTGLIAVVGVFGTLAAAISALNSLVGGGLSDFLATGLDILIQVAEGLGRAIGAFVVGFSSEIMTLLPALGAALSMFMSNALPFIVGIKMVDESVLNGVAMLAKCVIALCAADLISGMTSFMQMGSSFADLGTELSRFMINALPFISAARLLTPEMGEGVKNLADAILALTKANLLDSIASFFGGGVNFAEFGAQLQSFGRSIVDFSHTVKNVDVDAVNTAKTCADMMVELQKAIAPTGGVVQFFKGETRLDDFGLQLAAFGRGIKMFSDIVSMGNGINPEAIDAAAKAGMLMTELQKAVTPTGGVVQFFKGNQDLGNFGSQLAAFGLGVTMFSRSVTMGGGIDSEAIEAAKNAGMLMTELQAAITPNSGVIQWFKGDQDLGTFGTQLALYGAGVAAFSKSVSGENFVSEAAVTAAANAGGVMAELQKSLPEEHWFDGKMSLDDFGSKIKKFGKSVVEYSETVADIDTSGITMSLDTASKLVDLSSKITEIDSDKISNFNKVESIGETLEKYYNKIEDVNSSKIDGSVSSIKKLVEAVNSTSTVNTNGVSGFKTAINSLASTDFSGITKSFSSSSAQFSNIGSSMTTAINSGLKAGSSTLTATAKTIASSMAKAFTSQKSQFTTIGTTLITGLSTGIRNQAGKVKQAATSAAKNAASGAKGCYSDFYGAGKYAVQGFADGITANTFRASAKARAMAAAAAEAAKKELDEHSPSKVFYKIGDYAGLGFVNALGDYANKSYRAASEMAGSARSGLSDAISKVNDILVSDMDMQPTIRPVLDLSDVASGAGTLNGLFSNPSLGLMSNVRAINGMMNGTNQNGVNNDVVSALKDLKNTISGNTGNTYVVNGITYDDGSNVSSAIGELIRAARVERRI